MKLKNINHWCTKTLHTYNFCYTAI